MAELKRGDRVEWNYRSGTARGTVQRRLEKPGEVGGKRVNASAEDPRYVVKIEKTGRLVAYRPVVLRKQRK